MKIEHTIRDWLVLHPDFIEQGLEVIAKEHYLPDEMGSSGFIDILCKDIYNNFVIIEIKRSDSAARQTFTEVFKYAELIKKIYNARNSEIKIIIISTHWNEIIRAFSHACFTSNFLIKGLQIYTNPQTNMPEAMEEVIPISSRVFSRKFMSTQILYLFNSIEKRREAHQILNQKLQKAGVSDYIAIDLDAPINKALPYCFAINAAFQKYSIEELLNFIDILDGEQHLDMVKDDFESNEEYLDYLEQVFIASLEMGLYTDTIEVGYSEKFESIIEAQKWSIISINRYGIFNTDPRYNNELLLKELKGYDGGSFNKFVGFSESIQKERLKEIWVNCQKSLHHTPQWAEFINHVFSKLEKSIEKFKVIVDIYNPDSIVTSLYFTLLTGNAGYLPIFQVFIDYTDNKSEVYTGGVCSLGIKPYSKLFTATEYNEVANEIFRIQIAPDNEMDALRMGLCYFITRTIIVDDKKISNEPVSLDNGIIVPDNSKYISIENYINYNREALSLMVNNYNRVYTQL